MRTWRNIFEIVGSPMAVMATAFPLVVWFLVMAVMLEQPLSVVAKGFTFTVFSVAFLLTVVSWGIASLLFRRHYGRFLIALGICFLFLEGVLWYGFRFAGVLHIGEGEITTEYASMDKGKWTAKPAIRVAALKTSRSENGTVVLGLDGQKKEIPLNRKLTQDGYSFRVLDRNIAPLFVLNESEGQDDLGGYIKLMPGDGAGSYFHLGILPHRFYVGPPGEVSSEEKSRNSGNEGTPASFHLRVVRGKLKVVEGELKKGETVEFEGNRLRYEDGAPWVRVEVRKERRHYALFTGLLITVAGGITTVLVRKGS